MHGPKLTARRRRRPLALLAAAPLALAIAVAATCAGRARPPAGPPRLRDTAPERLSSMPGVDKESQPENVERRFGTEEAKQRREQDRRAHPDGGSRVDVLDKKQTSVPP